MFSQSHGKYILAECGMKSPLIPLMVIGILLSASFGLAMMSHMDEQGHSQCPFETAGATVCGLMQSPIEYAISHLNALLSFFTSTIVASFAGFLALLLLFTLSFSAGLFGNFKPKLLLARVYSQNSFDSPFRQQLIRWFALHENSPSSI